MSRGPQYDNNMYYHSKWKSVVNVMTHSNLDIAKIAQAGSRTKQRQRLDSDMDVIFSVVGNPSKRDFYPILISILQGNFQYDRVYPGGNYNVVHLDFASGGKFDLVLLSSVAFDAEYNQNLEYRKKNL